MRSRPIQIWQLTIATLSTVVVLVTVQVTMAHGQSPDEELAKDITKLDSFLSDQNLDSFEATVDIESAKWRKRDQRSFNKYMFKACSLISSYAIGDISERAEALSRYAVSVLSAGDLPLRENVEFVEFLMLDPLTIDEVKWKTLREQKAQLWLVAWQRVENSIDPKFNFDDWPQLNVQTPSGSGVPSGASPDSIKDEKLRAEYERAIAENSAKSLKYNDQYWLKRNAPSFYDEAERYLISAYARPPAGYSQLEGLLTKYIDDETVRSRILNEVRMGGAASFPTKWGFGRVPRPRFARVRLGVRPTRGAKMKIRLEGAGATV
jgi:hypothetical protein